MIVEVPSSQGRPPLQADHGDSAVAARKGEAACGRPGIPPGAKAERTGAETPTSKFVCCVIRCLESPEFITRGIDEGNETVHTVHFKDLAAVVCDSPIVEYERNRRNMRLHTLVLEEVIRDFTVLPVRFGNAAPSAQAGSLTDEEIERLGQTFLKLEARMEELKRTLRLEDEDLNLDLGPLGDLL